MCGRYSLTSNEKALARQFASLKPDLKFPDVEPRYNIAPSQRVIALHVAEGEVQVGEFRWGIQLPWARTVRDKSQINIRAEAALKPGYLRRMLDRQRILIPATHFYEWQARSGGPRQPMLIAPTQTDGLVFARLLGKWTDEFTGEVLPAVTILTTTPNQLLSGVHSRMPVILPASSWSRWLDSDATGDDVAELLRPCPDEWLKVQPISTRINNVAYDRPDVIEPVDA